MFNYAVSAPHRKVRANGGEEVLLVRQYLPLSPPPPSSFILYNRSRLLIIYLFIGMGNEWPTSS